MVKFIAWFIRLTSRASLFNCSVTLDFNYFLKFLRVGKFNVSFHLVLSYLILYCTVLSYPLLFLSILPLFQSLKSSSNYSLFFLSFHHPPAGVLLREKWSTLMKSKGKLSDSTRYAYLLQSLACPHSSREGSAQSRDVITEENRIINDNELYSRERLGNKSDSKYFHDIDIDHCQSNGRGAVGEEDKRKDEFSAISLDLFDLLVSEFKNSISDDYKNMFSLTYSSTSSSSYGNLPTDLLAGVPMKGTRCDDVMISVCSYFLSCAPVI